MFVCLAPPLTQQRLKDFDIERGQEVTITVTANGNPLPSCTWFHNDKQVHAKENRFVMTHDGPKHILKILNAELTDAGTYKVKTSKKEISFLFINIYFFSYFLRQLLKVKLVLLN